MIKSKMLLVKSIILIYFTSCWTFDISSSAFKIEKSSQRTLLPNISSTDLNDTFLTPSESNFISAENAVENKIKNKDKMFDLIRFIGGKKSVSFSRNLNRRSLTSYLSTTIKPEATTLSVLDEWVNMENITKTLTRSIIKNIMPSFMDMSAKLNISSTCTKEVMLLIAGLRDIKTWAFSFIDSSAQTLDGVLSGTLSSLGEYDQCLNTQAINDKRGKNFGKVMFTGKYCSLDVKPPLPPKKDIFSIYDKVEELQEFMQGGTVINEIAKDANIFQFLAIKLGICVPSGCNTYDVQQFADIASGMLRWSAIVKRCELKTENEYTPVIIGVLTAYSFIIFLFCMGTLTDLYLRHNQKKINHTFFEIIVCFSLIKNFKKLVDDSRGKMCCLHGFRFLSISWIIIGHTYLTANYTMLQSGKQALQFPRNILFQAVLNASVSVDTFFFISGLLVCYVTITIIRETGRPFNFILYITHRLFRLLPVYAIVICGTFLIPLMGSGPTWKETVQPNVDACYKNWWTNILFVNNFINVSQICFLHTWYIAADMQLYIAALIVILPILRWPRFGLGIAFLVIFASVITASTITYTYNISPTTLFVYPDEKQRLALTETLYFKPYSHAGPYCVGLITGYILATYPKLKFSVITKVIGWSCAVICNLVVLYSVHVWNSGREPEKVEALFYSGFHRVAWSLGIAWVVVNCVTGQGGIVNYILSWRVWVPLGRLTYTVYLIHFILQVVYVGNVRIKLQSAHYFAVWIFFGHLMVTLGLAFVASILVEAPFINLEKIVLRAIVGKPQNDANDPSAVHNNCTIPKTDHPESHNKERTENVISRL